MDNNFLFLCVLQVALAYKKQCYICVQVSIMIFISDPRRGCYIVSSMFFFFFFFFFRHDFVAAISRIRRTCLFI